MHTACSTLHVVRYRPHGTTQKLEMPRLTVHQINPVGAFSIMVFNVATIHNVVVKELHDVVTATAKVFFGPWNQ